MNRSYSKKRHINLVNEALEQAYLEKKSNKKILNEVGYYNNWIDVDFKNGTLKLNKYLDMENDSGAYNGDELQLQAGTMFRKKGDTLVTTNQTVKIVGDYAGSLKDVLRGVTVTYYCNTKRAKIDNTGDFYGENWASDTQRGFNDLCNTEYEDKKAEGGEKQNDKVKDNAKNCGWGDDVDGYKASGWQCPKEGATGCLYCKEKKVDPSTKKSSWDTTCDGESKPFKKGCKSETIKKVQNCLGFTGNALDGKFGSGTEGRVQAKIGKISFTNADIDKLCATSTNIGGGGTEEQVQNQPEEKVQPTQL